MPLKEFKDLTIRGEHQKCVEFLARMSDAMTGGWRRATDLEQRVPKSEELFAFVCERESLRPTAALVLTFRGERELYACNVVPSESGELTYDEYNAILDDFVNRFARRVASECGLDLTVSSGELDMTKLLSDDAFAALRTFSNIANRSTGSGHPLDARRWHEFLVLAHRQHSQLSADDMGRWLCAEGWDEDRVLALQIQYEQARALLRFYDGNQ